MPGFQVWLSPGGLVWEGTDQEEAFLVGLGLAHCEPDVIVEIAELYNSSGELRLRCIARHDDRARRERTMQSR